MEYKIVEKPAFSVAGKAIRVSTKDGDNTRTIPQFWRDSVSDGTHAKVVQMAKSGTVLGNFTLGICRDFAADMSEFTYMIAAESSQAPEGLTVVTIPASTWAVFPSKGPMPDAIQAVWGAIWSDFFPNSPYAHGPGADLEVYPPGNPMAPDYRSEVWIPVVAK